MNAFYILLLFNFGICSAENFFENIELYLPNTKNKILFNHIQPRQKLPNIEQETFENRLCLTNFVARKDKVILHSTHLEDCKKG
jgi:hypothetical protein